MSGIDEWTREDECWFGQFKKRPIGLKRFFKMIDDFRFRRIIKSIGKQLQISQNLSAKNERRIDELNHLVKKDNDMLTKEEQQMMEECEEFMKEVHEDPVVMAAEVPTERMWENIMREINARKMQKEDSQ